MKVYKKFNPIILEIKIESEHELCDLWHRMNVSKNNIDSNSCGLIYDSMQSNVNPIFDILDEYVRALNLVSV